MEYKIAKGVRRVEVKVEVQEPHEGTGTEITIEEGNPLRSAARARCPCAKGAERTISRVI